MTLGQRCTLQYAEPGAPSTTATVVLDRGALALRLQILAGGYVLNAPKGAFAPAYPVADGTIELLDTTGEASTLWLKGRGPIQLTGRGTYQSAGSLTYRARGPAELTVDMLSGMAVIDTELELGAVNPGVCLPGTLPKECRPAGRVVFKAPSPGASATACTSAPCVMEKVDDANR